LKGTDTCLPSQQRGCHFRQPRQRHIRRTVAEKPGAAPFPALARTMLTPAHSSIQKIGGSDSMNQSLRFTRFHDPTPMGRGSTNIVFPMSGMQ
jgi:hypothetical protein